MPIIRLLITILPLVFTVLFTFFFERVGWGATAASLGEAQKFFLLLELSIIVVVFTLYLKQSDAARKALFLGIWSVALTFFFVEGVASWLYYRWPLQFLTVRIASGDGPIVQFDRDRGFRMSSSIIHYAKYMNGKPAYLSQFKANNEGFLDWKDFTKKKQFAGEKRYLVFGDSFTAAPFLNKNWPQQTEEVLGRRGTPITLLNFSLEGYGIANWWVLLDRVARDYQADGVIFAVYNNDLRRLFLVGNDTNGRVSFERVPTWDVEKRPSNLSEYNHLSHRPIIFQVDRTDYESMKLGVWPKSVVHPFELIALASLRTAVSALTHLIGPPTAFDSMHLEAGKPLGDGQYTLFKKIRSYLAERNLNSSVVYIPDQDERSGTTASDLSAVKEFAQGIGATFIDASFVFPEETPKEISNIYLADGHWNQKGSDRFAFFMADFLSKQPQKPSISLE